MLSSPRNPPSKMLFPSASLRLTHHVKLSSSLWNTRSRNSRSPLPAALLIDLVDAPGRPRVHRRIHVVERPFVGGKLAVGVHVPLAQSCSTSCCLGELGIDQRERDAVEREIPAGVPRVLPLVGHRDHVGVVQLNPGVVAAVDALGGWRRAAPDRLRASRERCSGRTASTTAGRRTPGASPLRCRRSGRRG